MIILLENGNVLQFSSGALVKLPAEIPDKGYIYEAYGLIFVINNTIDSHNIWCFDQEGNKLWEIEPSLSGRPYHSITVNEQGRLVTYDQNSDNYFVDIKTGHIEWFGGDRGGDPVGINALLRQRHDERLKAEPIGPQK